MRSAAFCSVAATGLAIVGTRLVSSHAQPADSEHMAVTSVFIDSMTQVS